MNARALVPVLGVGLLVGACASKTEAPPARSTTHTSSAAVKSSGVDPRRILARAAHHQAELVEHCGELQTDDRYSTTLHLEIRADGVVELADARGSHTRLDACIAEVARGWTFDASNVRTVTDVPIVIERP